MWTEVTNASYLDGYRILVRFNDGASRVCDFSDLVRRYPVFRPLADLTLFRQFRVTDTLEREDGKIDIAPEYLYENGVPA